MIFEAPINVLPERIGARKTLFRILILWDAILATMAPIFTPTEFYSMRLPLGAAEAAFSLYLS